MKLVAAGVLATAALLVVSGCGGSSTPSSSSNGANPAPSSTPAATSPETTAKTAPTLLAQSLYDEGPRAAAGGAIDKAAAANGEKLFSTKGCTVCHAIGQKKTCPDLAGVTRRRTQAWMEHQILEPDVMTQTDPIAHEMFVTYKLQMTNFHLAEPDAKAIIQYLRSEDAGK
jgi:mono/diheme cytochrome c family protein